MKAILKCISLALILCTLIAAAAISAAADSTYILGDANGDGVVTIQDATDLQRLISGMITDNNGKIKRRGNVTGGSLDISDVTAIQYYLAEVDNPYKIGKTIHYDEYELPFVPN